MPVLQADLSPGRHEKQVSYGDRVQGICQGRACGVAQRWPVPGLWQAQSATPVSEE